MSDLLLVGFLLLMFSCKGSSQETAPPQMVTALVGDDVVLPCLLEPPRDAAQMTVEWGRPDLEPRFVFVRLDGKEHLVHQNRAYKGRTSLSEDKLKDGDVSLKLSDVRHSDNGRYRCYIPKETKEYFVDLLVGSVSSAGISLAGLDEGSSGVMLDCKSAGWFPEPQLFWLDGEGNVLPAGPPETSRGPDGLYSVSSRVTVEKRDKNNFTCRVQQKDMDQSRETHVHVPDEFFMVRSNCSAPVILAVVLCFILIAAVVVFIWRWRQRKVSTKKQPENKNEEQGQLMDEERSKHDKELKRTINDEEWSKREEELLRINVKDEEYLDHISEVFMKIQNELEEQKKQITALRQEEEKDIEDIEENEKKIKEVDDEVRKKKGVSAASREEMYLNLKEIIRQNKSKLEGKKKMCQQLDLRIDKLMTTTKAEMKKMEDRKQTRESKKETEERQKEKSKENI